jgi:hypothetical protein
MCLVFIDLQRKIPTLAATFPLARLMTERALSDWPELSAESRHSSPGAAAVSCHSSRAGYRFAVATHGHKMR